MGKYMVTYKGDTLNLKDRKRYYEINFIKKANKETFSLYPDIIENNKGSEGVTPNPDAKHYWNRDIFTYLTFLGDPSKIKGNDTSTFRNTEVKIGDTLFYSNGIIVLNKVVINPQNDRHNFSASDTALALDLSVISKDGSRYTSQPLLKVVNGAVVKVPDTIMAQSLVIQFNQVKNQQKGLLELGVKETSGVLDFVTLKAYEFPFINVLWLGIMVMVIGMVMSIYQRLKTNVKLVSKTENAVTKSSGKISQV